MSILLRAVCLIIISPLLLAGAVMFLCFMFVELIVVLGIYGLSGQWEEFESLHIVKDFVATMRGDKP